MQRVPFESLLLQIAEYSEEWLTSAQSLGLARRNDGNRVLPWDSASGIEGAQPVPAVRNATTRRGIGSNGNRPVRAAIRRNRQPARV
jgi:hypothetical protein